MYVTSTLFSLPCPRYPGGTVTAPCPWAAPHSGLRCWTFTPVLPTARWPRTPSSNRSPAGARLTPMKTLTAGWVPSPCTSLDSSLALGPAGTEPSGPLHPVSLPPVSPGCSAMALTSPTAWTASPAPGTRVRNCFKCRCYSVLASLWHCFETFE